MRLAKIPAIGLSRRPASNLARVAVHSPVLGLQTRLSTPCEPFEISIHDCDCCHAVHLSCWGNPVELLLVHRLSFYKLLLLE